MGNWKLEVFRMGVYMAFPVALFHYFNQPQYFEKWVTEFKREVYPPENPELREEVMAAIREVNRRYDERMLQENTK